MQHKYLPPSLFNQILPFFKTVLILSLILIIGIGIFYFISWDQLLIDIIKTQTLLQQKLTQKLHLIAKHGWEASGALISISFLYGLFHAAGPGHGKAVIITYLGSSPTQLRRGILLSLITALVQGLVAILLIEISMQLIHLSLRKTQETALYLNRISFIFVMIIGLLLIIKSVQKLYQYYRIHIHHKIFNNAQLEEENAEKDPYQCCTTTPLHASYLEQPITLKQLLTVILAIGLRPCTGAILILLGAYSMGLRWVGIIAVLVMSIGTGITVSFIAILTVSSRNFVLKHLTKAQKKHSRYQIFTNTFMLLGGILIFTMGIMLLLQGIQQPVSPLL
ncbi:nickel/cobalt transporter [Ignatzschineria cameli]|uniref:Nickel/cobalt efflux system n=1 Tax=Ignatzschineria cameli TaxID=2182793 RepID=A0ABX5L0F4_9GAMM|nr:nickel/cobalt transporter [Ignatzschineria cameli]PWD89910.1 hypothetical protein DC079_06130 [Ignatzschineria cameli]PWD91560.1 hypothetical protein DC081_05840 [Ignatzschineria cameli]PWD92597.1 hypothetical protein DC078_06125 [Ignatzschineria cameli]